MLTEPARARLKGLIDPLADLLIRLGLTANQLTLFGCLLHAMVAVLVWLGYLPQAGLTLVIAAGVDGLDGTVARRTGAASRFGAFLDSSLDRVSEIVVFGGILALAFRVVDPLLGILAYAALGGSIMVSYARAKSESLGVGTAVGWLGRFERMIILVLGLLINQLALALILIAIGSWVTAIQRLLDVAERVFD